MSYSSEKMEKIDENSDSMKKGHSSRKDEEEDSGKKKESGHPIYGSPPVCKSAELPHEWQDPYLKKTKSSRVFDRKSAAEVEEIVERMKKATVAWNGGKEYEGKTYCYYTPPETKSNPPTRIRRVERIRASSARRRPKDQISAIVTRLYTAPTTAFSAKIGPNPNNRFQTSENFTYI